jgi:hypothetical protein
MNLTQLAFYHGCLVNAVCSQGPWWSILIVGPIGFGVLAYRYLRKRGRRL